MRNASSSQIVVGLIVLLIKLMVKLIIHMRRELALFLKYRIIYTQMKLLYMHFFFEGEGGTVIVVA